MCSSVAGVGLVEGVLGDGDDGRVEVDGRQVQQVAVSEVRRPYKLFVIFYFNEMRKKSNIIKDLFCF